MDYESRSQNPHFEFEGGNKYLGHVNVNKLNLLYSLFGFMLYNLKCYEHKKENQIRVGPYQACIPRVRNTEMVT